jgi:hypothetical protein
MAAASAQAFSPSAKTVVSIGNFEIYQFYGAPKADGVTEKSLAITLPRNAIVRKYEVVLQAATAHAVIAGTAGQLRTTAITGGVSVVIDFGTPRTVSAIGAPSGGTVKSVATWIGTEFGAPKLSEGSLAFARLPSEVRTERLLVEFTGSNLTTDRLATEMVLVLPEAPAGIELRIDGAAPAFAQNSAVDPTDSEALSTQTWNKDSERVVDLGPALAALTGDPLDETPVTFTATLTSRVPGQLDLLLREGGQEVHRIRRARFDGQPARELTFDGEGRATVVLESLPPDLTVHEARLTARGKPAPERVIPPVGPELPEPPFATLALTPDRAVCVRVPRDPRFAEVNGVRLALAAGSDGAEARVQLWKSQNLDDTSPAEPLENGATAPVTLSAGPEAFHTFNFAKPIPAPTDCVWWAVLAVHRGLASLGLAEVSIDVPDDGDGAASDDPGKGAEPLYWGAPTGPWHDLPPALSAARGRIRTIGKAVSEVPFAPLELALTDGGTPTPIIPNAKGTPATLTGPVVAAGPLTLVVTSYAKAAVTLENIDVISTS